MFGLEDQGRKKKKADDFVFDLEQALRSPTRHGEIIDLVEKRVQNIKETLRSGGNRADFDKFGVLLHGYMALLKVTSRVQPATR